MGTIILDVGISDDNTTSQLGRITPGDRWINEACPANAEGGKTLLPGTNVNDNCDGDAHYGYPWPLSEDFYLVTEGSGKYNRILLLDKFGDREVICSRFSIPKVSGLRIVGPMPFRARRRPPVVPTATGRGNGVLPRLTGPPSA